MLGGFDVIVARDVRGPFDIGELGAGNRESQVGPAAGRLNQETFERRLPVGAVGSEIGESEPARQLARLIGLAVDRALERPRQWGAVFVLKATQRWTAGEGEVEVIARDLFRREIGACAARQTGERDGGVDIVEGAETRVALDEGADGYALRHEGADDHRIGRGDLLAPVLEGGQIAIKHEPAVGWSDEIAVFGVPGLVAFEKGHVVTALMQRLDQRPIGCGVAVPPGRGERQAAEDEAERARHAAASWRRCTSDFKMPSTCAPRLS